MREEKIILDDGQNTVGGNLRWIRKSKDLLQKEAAARAQLYAVFLEDQALSKIERGKQHIKISQLRCLKELLGVAYKDILEKDLEEDLKEWKMEGMSAERRESRQESRRESFPEVERREERPAGGGLRPEGFGPGANLVGGNIRRLRQARKIGQTEMAAKLQVSGVGITREALVKIEMGRQHIKLSQLRGIREFLGVRYEELLDGPEGM